VRRKSIDKLSSDEKNLALIVSSDLLSGQSLDAALSS